VSLVKGVDILDQSIGGAAVAFGQEEASGVGAMRRDAADARRVLPDGERGIAVADHARSRLDEERQHVPQDFRWDRNHAVGRKQSAEHVSIAKRVDDAQLGEDTGRQAKIHPDRGHMPATNTTTGGDDQFVFRKCCAQGVDEWINRSFAAIDNRTPADLYYVAKRQHAHYGRFGRGHNLLIEQALAHQHRFDVMTPIEGTFFASWDLTEG